MPDRFECTVIVILFAAFGIYTGLLTVFDTGELLGWLTTFLSTLLSISAAFVIGRYLYRYQAAQNDDKRREELEYLVKQELRGFLSSLKYKEIDQSEKDSLMVRAHVYLNPLILEEVVKSGLFSSESTYNFVRMSGYIHTHNMNMNVFNSLLFTNPNLAKMYGESIWNIQDSVINNCEVFLKNFGDNLTDFNEPDHVQRDAATAKYEVDKEQSDS